MGNQTLCMKDILPAMFVFLLTISLMTNIIPRSQAPSVFPPLPLFSSLSACKGERAGNEVDLIYSSGFPWAGVIECNCRVTTSKAVAFLFLTVFLPQVHAGTNEFVF